MWERNPGVRQIAELVGEKKRKKNAAFQKFEGKCVLQQLTEKKKKRNN